MLLGGYKFELKNFNVRKTEFGFALKLTYLSWELTGY